MMNKQKYFPKVSGASVQYDVLIKDLGLAQPNGTFVRRGKDWQKHQVLRHDGFLLNLFEGYRSVERLGYTRQEDYIKINFWLRGRHTTVLNGYGQHEHDCPEVFITAGPLEMIKVDLHAPNTNVASVALCVQRDYFSRYLHLDPEALPDPLRGLVSSRSMPFTFYRLPLSTDLAAAARSILAASPAVRQDPMYVEAKAIELSCLLIDRLQPHAGGKSEVCELTSHKAAQIYEARDYLTHHFREVITVDQICRKVGINKMALTSGFRRVFGTSVHAYLTRMRMEHAYELLQDDSLNVSEVADQVGFRHACNFSTAFRSYFGCAPLSVRHSRS